MYCILRQCPDEHESLVAAVVPSMLAACEFLASLSAEEREEYEIVPWEEEEE